MPLNFNLHLRSYFAALSGQYILILTSNIAEKDAVNRVLQHTRRAEMEVDNLGCRLGLLGGRFALHICGESGASKMHSIGSIASRLLADSHFPTPVLVILAGFCWGNLDRVAGGSLIIGSSIRVLNERRETDAGTEYRDKVYCSPLKISSEGMERVKCHLSASGNDAVQGCLASLETRFESNAARDAIIRQFPDVLGGEMEAFGFVPSCAPPWLVLKAVSDSGGSNFDTKGQKEAAERAAQALPVIVDTLERDGILGELMRATPARRVLADVLLGDTIRVSAQSTSHSELNDYLDGVIWPIVEDKLRSCGAELEYGPEFAPIMCDLLLELIQNAIRHGRATDASMSFAPTKITLTDDGDWFDPRALVGNNGGARAWRAACQGLGLNELFKVQPERVGKRGNQYTFALAKVSDTLSRARRECQIQINPRSIASGFGRPDILNVDGKCSAFYLDVENIRMTSRRVSVARALAPLLEAGKTVFVACASQRDVLLFKEELASLAGNQLRVFLK
jgi:nucleoside phosphorylase